MGRALHVVRRMAGWGWWTSPVMWSERSHCISAIYDHMQRRQDPKTWVALACLAFAVWGCQPASSASPGGGLTSQRATTLARSYLTGEGSEVTNARAGPFRELAQPGTGNVFPQDRWVWAVTFRGEFPGACGPITTEPRESCPVSSLETVLIDYFDGTFVLAYTAADELVSNRESI